MNAVGGSEMHGFVQTQIMESGSEENVIRTIEEAIMKVNTLIYDNFARSMVSQNEV